MKEEQMSELTRVLEEWSNSVPSESPIKKTYEIDDDNNVILNLFVSFGDDPATDESFIGTCKADVSSVKRLIVELENKKASFL